MQAEDFQFPLSANWSSIPPDTPPDQEELIMLDLDHQSSTDSYEL